MGFKGPPGGSILKKVDFQDVANWGSLQHLVGTLNLCLEKPDTMQKDLVQSEHPVLRKQ